MLCTDGLLEAQDADGVLLSFDGVADFLANIPVTANAQMILDTILANGCAFTLAGELRSLGVPFVFYTAWADFDRIPHAFRDEAFPGEANATRACLTCHPSCR